MSTKRFLALVQLRAGLQALPIEQGTSVKPSISRHHRRSIFAALRLLAMIFITLQLDCLYFRGGVNFPSFLPSLAVLTSVPSGLSIPTCLRMLKALCVCSCGTKTKRLSAVASQLLCKWPRHEHRSSIIPMNLNGRTYTVRSC